MAKITSYKLEAIISGGVTSVPNRIAIRYNDLKTPWLDVWVSYMTPDGKKRPFVLTDKKITFESITPGGAAAVFSSESSSYFEVINHVQGHFIFQLPPECKDGHGSSKQAYFRFVKGDEVHSTGDFVYHVTKDVYSAPAGDLKTPMNFNEELKKLRGDVERLADLAHTHVNKSILDALTDLDGRLFYNEIQLATKYDLLELMNKVRDEVGELLALSNKIDGGEYYPESETTFVRTIDGGEYYSGDEIVFVDTISGRRFY